MTQPLGRGRLPLLLSLSLVCAAIACGDDEPETEGDGGAEEDGSVDESPTLRPRDNDASTGDPVEDPIPECERQDPIACDPGTDCKVVIRRAPTDSSFLIYTGCIERRRWRGLGAPCNPWDGFNEPYEAEGSDDEIYTDPCEPGLFCALDPDVRNSYSCQPACEPGGLACEEPGDYCFREQYSDGTRATVYEGVCRSGDACDPTRSDSCGPDRGCFLRFNDDGTRVLAVCLPAVSEPIEDGEQCQFLNDCAPGSTCWGPPRFAPEDWSDSDLRCRRMCELGAVDDDAGQEEPAEDDDAGTADLPDGVCASGQSCVDLGESGLDLSSVSVDFGHCE